ncbi:hypothetical protein F5144DRAFT_547198 [Chaetomium tenue]|uniref:Uncharacterized protein n=1 Tax=Chaetomium tenue TaxID=1854479 RepID=A0ACB7PDQ2_9PEZI|nr:hypothetical protein F5144DRAFT_547198 [Chaetomium globosum]
MLSPLIVALLLPPALALTNPGAAAIAGRQEDENCKCQMSLDNGAMWTIQPSSMIRSMCDEGSGQPDACITEEFGQVCVGSEDRTSCECVVQSAIKWESQAEEGNWTLMDIHCAYGNVTVGA